MLASDDARDLCSLQRPERSKRTTTSKPGASPSFSRRCCCCCSRRLSSLALQHHDDVFHLDSKDRSRYHCCGRRLEIRWRCIQKHVQAVPLRWGRPSKPNIYPRHANYQPLTDSQIEQTPERCRPVVWCTTPVIRDIPRTHRYIIGL